MSVTSYQTAPSRIKIGDLDGILPRISLPGTVATALPECVYFIPQGHFKELSGTYAWTHHGRLIPDIASCKIGGAYRAPDARPTGGLFRSPASMLQAVLRLILVHELVHGAFLVRIRAQKQVGRNDTYHEGECMSQYHFHNIPFLCLVFTMQENCVEPPAKKQQLYLGIVVIKRKLGLWPPAYVTRQSLDCRLRLAQTFVEQIENIGNFPQRVVVADWQLLDEIVSVVVVHTHTIA